VTSIDGTEHVVSPLGGVNGVRHRPPHQWPFSTHYFGQPKLCLSTIIGTDSAGIEGVLSPLGDNIDFCVFRENAEGEHRKPSVT
jgi:hypothetical protein